MQVSGIELVGTDTTRRYVASRLAPRFRRKVALRYVTLRFLSTQPFESVKLVSAGGVFLGVGGRGRPLRD